MKARIFATAAVFALALNSSSASGATYIINAFADAPPTSITFTAGEGGLFRTVTLIALKASTISYLHLPLLLCLSCHTAGRC
jgi:hypothetical protein